MQKIVATILHAAGGSQIRILRTVAHGDSEVYNFPYLWNTNLVSEEYKQLRRVFAPNARFELHGCGVASETSILKPGVNMRDTRVDNTVSGTVDRYCHTPEQLFDAGRKDSSSSTIHTPLAVLVANAPIPSKWIARTKHALQHLS